MVIKDFMILKRGNVDQGINMEVDPNGNASMLAGTCYLSLTEIKVIAERLETLEKGFKSIQDNIKS